ncbi:hypothetical protein H2248_009149 [Termitomyces sp. 'cryptogamus']|nr:hypothetical protein H2248_009149 [Termitomyces sp. 'cryptogamus']
MASPGMHETYTNVMIRATAILLLSPMTNHMEDDEPTVHSSVALGAAVTFDQLQARSSALFSLPVSISRGYIPSRTAPLVRDRAYHSKTSCLLFYKVDKRQTHSIGRGCFFLLLLSSARGRS